MEEKVFSLQEQIENWVLTLEGKIAAFQTLGDLHAELDGKVSRTTLMYLHNNPEAKKISSEKVEMIAAVTPQEQADYFELRAVRIRVKIAEKVIEACHTAISAIQSMMKMFGNIQYGGQK
jgi:hypothetical protein